MRPVTVQFLKNPDHIHWGFEANWLGEDEWGVWIGAPRGTRRWRGGEIMTPSTTDAVFCSPRDEWWHLHFNGVDDNSTYTHFIDIVTPPIWVSENRYEMIDLDLDVAVHLDGTIEVQDEDEFEIHQVKYGYSEEMIKGAVEETKRVVAALEAGQEPFFEVASAWMARLGG